MSGLHAVSASPLLQAIGWTVVHSAWQIAVVAGLLAVLLRLTRHSAPRVRYGLAILAMLAMLGLPLVAGQRIHAIWAEHTACWRLAEHTDRADLPGPCWAHGLMPPQAQPEVKDSGGTPPHAERLSLEFTAPAAWLGLAWLGGAALLLVRLLLGWLHTWRLRCRGTVPAGRALDGRLRELAQRLGVRTRVTLLLSESVEVPTVVGWRRPTILLPWAAVRGLHPCALDAVLAHELAHVGRCDFLANLLQCAVDALLFHHPLARWASRRARDERELCCDYAAIDAVPGSLASYLRALVTLDTLRPTDRRWSLAVTGSSSLLARVRHLAGVPLRRIGMWPLTFALLLAAVLFWVPLLRIESPAALSAWAVMETHLRAQLPAAAAPAVAPPAALPAAR